jgi:hypothetical protein
MSRTLSYSEIQCAMTCQARHAFCYTGHLTGGETLKRRQMKPILSNGRAWGAAVAAWHAFSAPEGLMEVFGPGIAQMTAHGALRESYAHDVIEQRDLGINMDIETQIDRVDWVGKVLDHYMSTAKKLPNLTRLEGEVNVPIPSRSGKRGSSRYRFQGYLDGFTDDDGLWIVEYKLRDNLTPVDVISLSRQIRSYAWCFAREADAVPVGVIVDERLAAFPKPARLVKGKKKSDPDFVPSHSKDQMTTPEMYIALCEKFDEDPHDDVVEHLGARQWQQRVPITFTEGELEEVGEELVSAAKTIRDLDSGERYPVRNTQPQLCRSCRWKEACAAPDERVYLESLFDYTVPKRLRGGQDVNVETVKGS